MSLLKNDNEIISMITEGKIQAAEQATKKKLNESLQEELHRDITRGKLEAAGMLEDDRQKYSAGGALTKLIGRLTKNHQKKIIKENPMMDDLEAAQHQLDFFDYEQARRLVLDGDMTVAEAKINLEAVGYDMADIETFLKKLDSTSLKPKLKGTPVDPKIADEAYAGKMTDEEIDKALEDLRDEFAEGGMLTDDREQYKLGKLVAKAGQALSELPDVARDTLDVMKMKMKGDMTQAEKIKLTEDMYKDSVKNYIDLKKSLKKATSIDEEDAIREMLDQEGKLISEFTIRLKKMGVTPSMKNLREEKKIPQRIEFAEGGALLADDMPMEETHMMPDGTEMPGATHEEYETSMSDMEPDTVMEDDYLEFVLDEALTPEEQSFLTQELEQNTQLAMVFDKVIDVAQEFAGSGPVEGPGSGVSDSIPARLSDGEFVFTAKAVDQIGADKLMAMMKDAEMEADGRQDLAEGGMPEEDIRVVKTTVDNGGKGLLDEDEISKSIKSKMMLDNRTGRHIQS